MQNPRLHPDFESAFRSVMNRLISQYRLPFLINLRKIDASTLKNAFAVHSPERIVQAEQQIRAIVDSELHKASPLNSYSISQKTRKFIRFAVQEVPVLAIFMTTSASGWVREEALRYVTRLENQTELALILIRLNDWVPEIRKAASEAIYRILQSAPPGRASKLVMFCIPVFLDPNSFGRAHHEREELIAPLLHCLERDGALGDFILKDKTDLAPKYLRLVLRRGLLIDRLPVFAMEASHQGVRRFAAKAILWGYISWREHGDVKKREINIEVNKDFIAEKCLQDKYQEVRRVALEYITWSPQSALYDEAIFRSLLPSSSRFLAYLAAHALIKMGIDVRAELLGLLEKETAPPVWVAKQLEDLGEAEDAPLIYAMSKKSEGIDRIFWLVTAALLGSEEAKQALLVIALNDQNYSYAKQASGALRKSGQKIAFQDLLPIAQKDELESRGLMRFVKHLTALEITRIAIQLHRAKSEVDFDGLWSLIARKRNRGAFKPTQSEIDQLKSELRHIPEFEMRANKVLGLDQSSLILNPQD